MREKPLILVAEDSKADMFLIREALATAEVEANLHVVTDGNAATEFIDATDADENTPCPTLVLLDMNLPKRTGNEVLQHLRSSERCREAPVIIVSSSNAPRDRAVVTDMNLAGYFKKPNDYVEFMTLGPLVKSLLDAQKHT
jgi:CheY-like chemotaxis protein